VSAGSSEYTRMRNVFTVWNSLKASLLPPPCCGKVEFPLRYACYVFLPPASRLSRGDLPAAAK
jgi:hypothetical protein